MIRFWRERFLPAPPPPWLDAFHANPSRAVDALLWGRSDLGSLHGADPTDLLIGWVELLADEDELLLRLDHALASWVGRYWGTTPGHRRRARVAVVWARVADLVAGVEVLESGILPHAVRALRERFDQAQAFLEPLGDGATRDPFGRYLHAVALTQGDRSLEPAWWKLCDLVGETPFDRGGYGVDGLSVLSLGEELPPRLAIRALVRFGRALARRIDEGALDSAEAENEWLGVAWRTLARHPEPDAWVRILRSATDPEEPLAAWLGSLLSGSAPR